MVTYRIKISTSIGSKLQGITQYARFPKCKNGAAGDKFTFNSSCIIIECNRSNLQKKEEIENNPGNTLRSQIMRALLLYYAANAQKARVYSICVTRILKNDKVLISDLRYDKVDEQPLRLGVIPVSYQFVLADLVNNIMDDDYQLYATIVSHWLGAWTVKERYGVFARLWRCLEQLGVKSYHGTSKREMDYLEALREFIRNHGSNIPKACNHVDTMTYTESRAYFCKLLIFNNFRKTAGTNKYKEYQDWFVLPYHDERVLQMLLDTLVYRTTELGHYFAAVNNHLVSELPNHIKKNEDVVAILCGYYAYYTRNKIFHGELSERSFNICRSKDDDVIDKLNALMVKLTFELINVYQLL